MLKTVIDRNLDSGVTTVRLDGALSPGTVPEVGTAIAKAAAECPPAVIVDLAGLGHDDDAVLSVFATITHDAQLHWGVPVLLCAAAPGVREGLETFRTYVALYEDRSHAMIAVHANVPRWVRRHLLPDPGSAAIARTVTGEACLTWGAGELYGPARLVANELVANAIVHARSEFDLTVVHTGRYLRIAVQDGSTDMPRCPERPAVSSTVMRPGSGRGLRIVAATATHWGATPLLAGKIVWALIRSGDAVRD
ncbi:STAS domain-containing protein [Paractinoplanes maris]|uniref:STAS domain-containing protein n=1 Tax=Paractinoplanes maris TaxID=1734446 RepID=UPI00202030B9|nr:STAS domain-containing protein [Actinoplanes maris]